MTDVPHKCRVYLFSLHAACVATGHTIQAIPIDSGTIKEYLAAAAKFLGNFCGKDPHKHTTWETKISPLITKLLDEVALYNKPKDL